MRARDAGYRATATVRVVHVRVRASHRVRAAEVAGRDGGVVRRVSRGSWWLQREPGAAKPRKLPIAGSSRGAHFSPASSHQHRTGPAGRSVNTFVDVRREGASRRRAARRSSCRWRWRSAAESISKCWSSPARWRGSSQLTRFSYRWARAGHHGRTFAKLRCRSCFATHTCGAPEPGAHRRYRRWLNAALQSEGARVYRRLRRGHVFHATDRAEALTSSARDVDRCSCAAIARDASTNREAEVLRVACGDTARHSCDEPSRR